MLRRLFSGLMRAFRMFGGRRRGYGGAGYRRF